MSKKMKSFKEKLNTNKGVSVSGEKISTVVKVQVKENLVVAIDRGNYRVNDNELSMYVKDVFQTVKNINKDDIIHLYEYCDAMFNLKFIGAKQTESSRTAYMRIC